MKGFFYKSGRAYNNNDLINLSFKENTQIISDNNLTLLFDNSYFSSILEEDVQIKKPH